jgi:two-component system, chemotaxis family, sensor kinase CheA
MPDKEDFIALFIAEAEERLTKMDSALVQLEKNPDNVELIKDLNREAHSLKGSSRAFEFLNIQDIFHKVEDIFDNIIINKNVVDPQIIDAIFNSLDVVRNILKDSDDKLDVSELCTDLDNCVKPKSKQIETKPVTKRKKIAPKKDNIAQKAEKKITVKPLRENTEEINEPKNVLKESKESRKKRSQQDALKVDYIRVPLNKVNTLLDLMGEVTVDRMRVSEKIIDTKVFSKKIKNIQKTFNSLTDSIQKISGTDEDDIGELIGKGRNELHLLEEEYRRTNESISEDLYYMDPIIDDLQKRIKDLRMLPCRTIFDTYPRMIRDIALKEEKEVDLEISGDDTEVDMKMLEALKDPLMHIIRNCIDHGIELPDERELKGKSRKGSIKILVKIEGAHTVITVEDDGKGIDLKSIKEDALNKKMFSSEELDRMTDDEIKSIIFMNGYSSSKIITDVSGRGIGLDIVKRNIEQLQGQMLLDFEKDRGTKFTIVLPITISIFKVILVESNDMVFAVPMASITKCLSVSLEDISTVEGKMAIELNNHIIPVVDLKDVLQLPAAATDNKMKKSSSEENTISIFILSSLNSQVGFIVDEIVGDREVFIKSLGNHIGKIDNVSGAAILENGEAIVTLDTTELIANSTSVHSKNVEAKLINPIDDLKKQILIVDDSFSTRELTKNILETHDYLVDSAIDGLDAMDKVTQKSYDLIVTDIQMPRMDGFEFCKALKDNDKFKDVPIIIVTTLEKEEDKRRGIEVGASYYIVKSNFKQETLLEAIERLIK